jgi:8-oxo-dGTP diphosphatase
MIATTAFMLVWFGAVALSKQPPSLPVSQSSPDLSRTTTKSCYRRSFLSMSQPSCTNSVPTVLSTVRGGFSGSVNDEVDHEDDMYRRFVHRLPKHRLGRPHDSLASFRKAVETMRSTPLRSKQYTLIVVTESKQKRILLGRKNRGFGTGMYNSFGGKLDSSIDPTDVHGAMRELAEETCIVVPSHEYMAQSKVGTLHFTFEDSDEEMIVQLFRVDIDTSTTNDSQDPGPAPHSFPVDPSTLQACDEITPEWFDDWYHVPLHNMFADDSLWLPHLLSTRCKSIHGWFHFRPGGQHTNSIRDYFLDAILVDD